MMAYRLLLSFLVFLAPALVVQRATAQVPSVATVASPDGRIAVDFALSEQGEPTYTVRVAGRTLLEPSPLGLATTMARWDRDLELLDAGEEERIVDAYRLLHGKRSDVRYEANARRVELADDAGRRLIVAFQVSNDGLALRYEIPAQPDVDSVTAHRDLTGFRFAPAARSWLMPMDHPETGWMRTNPSYEAHYRMNEPVGVESPTEVGWAFPGLFHVDGVGWALVSEAGLEDSFAGGRLRAEPEQGLYRVIFPDRGEGFGPDDPVDPTFALPFASPWRVVIAGETLGPIVESTLVTDVSQPSTLADTSWIRPGKASWSWLARKDESIVPDVQRAFIDMAAEYGFEYTLVDNWWDTQIGYEGLEELATYAAGKGVGLIAWYNSNGTYNDAPQSPRDRMHQRDVRRAEFARLREMGIRGVKVDFMGGDKQSVIRHYLDVLRDAADFQILVNFHGATLPRGWERTYPHFVTIEAVRGYEYTTFDQFNADAAPAQGTVLVFTRNVVGPMDYTTTMLTDRVGAATRRTGNGYDLGMLVAYESGVQHLGVTPDDMARVPSYVSEFIGSVPAAWDETKFVDGFPGDFVVLARRAGERWYVAGLNGRDEQRTVQLDLPFVDDGWQGTLIGDGSDDGFGRRTVSRGDSVEMPARSGFVLTIE